MKKETFYSRDFILGIVLMALMLLLYVMITGYFDYGEGRVFVQILLGAIYLWGVRYIFKCDIPIVLKLILCFWWVPMEFFKAFLV